MSNNLLGASNIIGYLSDNIFSQGATRALNATATWQAFSFIAQGKTLSEIRVWQTFRTGSPIAADITASLCTANPFNPNATPTEVVSVSSIPATTGLLTFTGFTTTLNLGEMYWIVLKNLNATPGTNNVTVATNILNVIPTNTNGWNNVATLNSGGAWATTFLGRCSPILIKYSDGTFDGLPVRSTTRADSVGSGSHIYGTRARGVKFNGLIAGLTYNISAVSAYVARVGSPASLRARIYNNAGTLLGTTSGLNMNYISLATAGGQVQLEFPSFIPCPAENGPYRVVLDQNGGDVSNYYRCPMVQAFDTLPETLSLAPMSGTWCATSTTDNTAGTISWTDTLSDWPPIALSLDSDVPFTVSGGGGGGDSRIEGGRIR